MKRRLEPELLDSLPADNRAAIRSRGDLVRVNAWMRHPAVLARALAGASHGSRVLTLADLGSGDGTLLLAVARQNPVPTARVRALLIDRHSIVTPATLNAFAQFNWCAEPVHEDVFEWVRRFDGDPRAVIAVVANLFLHHFTDDALGELFREIACRAEVFIGLEPRRAWHAIAGAGLLGVIGCGPITRHDAMISVRAGFKDRELSDLWKTPGWDLTERPAGVFSHLFVARRRE